MKLQVGSLVVAEMLYRTNLVAMVAGGRKPKFADNTVLATNMIISLHDVDLPWFIGLSINAISSTFEQEPHRLCFSLSDKFF